MNREEMNTITRAVLMGTGAVWLAWEIVLLVGRALGQQWDLISVFTKDGAARMLAVPFLWGVLTGHFFLTLPEGQKGPLGSYGWILWAGLGAAFLISDIFLWNVSREALPSAIRILRTPFLALMLGLAAGFLGWGQSIKM